MKPRACLIVVLLASPAWSQEPVVNAPAGTARSFDFSNESVKKIVRDTAATQFAIAQVSRDATIKSEPAGTFKYVPPEEAPAPAPVPKAPRPQPVPPSNSFLSAMFETLFDVALDSALGLDSEYAGAASDDRWRRCESRTPLKTTQLGYDTCPAKNRDNAQ